MKLMMHSFIENAVKENTDYCKEIVSGYAQVKGKSRKDILAAISACMGKEIKPDDYRKLKEMIVRLMNE